MTTKPLNKYIVHLNDSMSMALERINSNSVQSVFVVDDRSRLIGALTDGDVRRALLANKPVQELFVKDLMNRSALYLPDSTSRQEQIHFMQRMQIRQLPLINSDEVITDVLFSEGLRDTVLSNVKVVLMAGGLGTRLRPITEHIPKPMVEVNDRPIIEHVISNFVDEGFRCFIASVNYKGDVLKDFLGDGSRLGVEIEYVDEPKRMGTAGSLSLMDDLLSPTFFVSNCDLVTAAPFHNMYAYHQDHQAVATMAVRDHSVQINFGTVELQGLHVRAITEKPQLTFQINAGFYVLNKTILKYIPRDSFADMPNVIHAAAKDGEPCIAYPTQEFWIDIGNPDDLERARSKTE